MIRVIHDPNEAIPLLTAAEAEATRGRATIVGWGRPLRGVFVVDAKDDDEAEIHVTAAPEARGREAIEAGREMVEWAGLAGIRLVAKSERREVRIYARLCGMKAVSA